MKATLEDRLVSIQAEIDEVIYRKYGLTAPCVDPHVTDDADTYLVRILNRVERS